MGDCEQVTGKGKAKKDYSAWSVEESKMLLQLMVDAASREWRDANGVLSKATVETKILLILNEKLRCQKTYCHYQSGTQPQRTLFMIMTLRPLYQIIMKHHKKIHHSNILLHPYLFRPIFGQVPQKAQARGNELDQSMKGMVANMRHVWT
ncbi:unnamed protein product [Prunus armeniaca]